MAVEEEMPEDVPPRRSAWNRAARIVGYVLAALLALLVAVVAFLHSPPGRQFIVDQISKYAPASGLSVEVGSIDGSVLWSATFNDVELRDAEGTLFFEAPAVELNWRPFRWLFSGLDVRHLVVANATLYAPPVLLPGDPDAPILPDFDIRVDRLLVDDMHVAEGLLGEERVIDFRASADIRQGRLFLDALGEFGGGDEFSLLAEAEPDGDIFDLDLNWKAPAGGFLATMVGAEEDLVVDLEGDGSWSRWDGELLAIQGERTLLDFDIANDAGRYRMEGEARPGSYVEGMSARALGEVVTLAAEGTLVDSVLDGKFALRGDALSLDGEGAVDLADNAFAGLVIDAQLLEPRFFGSDIALDDARLDAMLDGPFRDFAIEHDLRVGRLDASGTIVDRLAQRGVARFSEGRLVLPLDLGAARVTSGIELADPRLVDGRVEGTLVYTGNRLSADNLAIRFRGVAARLSMDGNLDSGRFDIAGPVRVADLVLEEFGRVDAEADIGLGIGGSAPWTLSARLDGAFDEVSSPALSTIAGEEIAFTGNLALGQAVPVDFTDLVVNATKLDLQLDGQFADGVTTLTGNGEHADYGPFTLDAEIGEDGPRAQLLLASPLPAARLSDVSVAIAPSAEGYAIETSGGSLLGPFDGLLSLVMAEEGETTINVRRLDVAETRISGQLALVEGGVDGRLGFARGGVDGAITLAPRGGGQGLDAQLAIRNARFGGSTPISIARADVDIAGVLGGEDASLDGTVTAQGISYGTIFLGRFAADAAYSEGTGHFDAALAGRRGSRFEMLLNGEISPERIAMVASGSHAGSAITMPRRAVLLATGDGGWQLQPTQIGYGDGYAIMRGRFGGEGPTEGRLSLSNLPLSLADIALDDLGLGGTVSGVIELGEEAGLPVGEARIMVEDLRRSGLLLTSHPIDLAAVFELSPTLLQGRAVIEDGSGVEGRLTTHIANLPRDGALGARLYRGNLEAQLRYQGPAESLWRLAAIDLLDITGDMEIATDIRGTLEAPQVRGNLRGDDLTVQSALTGTVVNDVAARGRFDGSRLQLQSFSGTAPNGGQVSGSGFVDLANMTGNRGPQIDLRLAARNARILDLPEMSATVTGPMRIVSSGVGGTLAGRLQVDAAHWQLAAVEEDVALPDFAVTEVNVPADIAPVTRQGQPWRYLIDASAEGGIEVDGMGLDSEWRGDIRLRGTTSDPRIGGEARIVPRQGFYSFAGVYFDITRGRIEFDENVPIDPRIDLIAETDVDGLDVSVSVQGSASQPDIAFNSVPALPEEELLARLLFGGSITDLSATDAVQLGAALASLRGGSGIGPINQLRDAVGLDRLRILGPDPALDRGTAVALGKNISRSFYGEIITDGQGYNVTELEYRITSWLSLLGTVSTIGRGSVAAEYSKDY